MKNRFVVLHCRKLLSMLLVLVLLLSITGCADEPAASTLTSAAQASAPTKADTAASKTTASQTSAAAAQASSAAAEAKWPGDPNLNSPGTLPICKDKVTLTIGVAQSTIIENWETNLQTLAYEEKGNYDLTFVEFPSDAKEMTQKIDLMVAAGGVDLPDIIMGNMGGQANLVKYGKAGMVVPLNEYYDNLAYYTNESMKNVSVDCLKYITSYDGNIYCMFNIMESLNNSYSGARIMLYEPWLEKLGLEAPTTTEEFRQMLQSFKDNDPNGNGLQDEIPLVGYKDVMTTNYAYFLMTPFVYTQSNYWTYENGKIGVAFNTDGWREGLRYTKQLIDEGLLSPLSFTQDRAQMTAMISPDPATVGSFVYVSTSILGAEDMKRGEYIITPPLEGPTGRREQVMNPTLPSIAMVITKNCKTPEAAFMLGDLMCSEEMSIWQRWGREGEDWEKPAAGDKSVYDALGYAAIIKVTSTAWGNLQNIWWGQVGPYIVDARYPAGQVATDSPFDHNIPIARSIAPQIEYANQNPIVGLIYDEAEQEIITELHSTILTYVKESYTRFVMGDLSLDADWDKYLAEFDKMGLAEVIEATQSAYDRMNTK